MLHVAGRLCLAGGNKIVFIIGWKMTKLELSADGNLRSAANVAICEIALLRQQKISLANAVNDLENQIFDMEYRLDMCEHEKNNRESLIIFLATLLLAVFFLSFFQSL